MTGFNTSQKPMTMDAQPTGSRPGPILSVRGLSQRYQSGGGRLVLDGVDLDIRQGSFACLVGPSGAGKTTLLRCMSGLLTPTEGEVLLHGKRVDRPPASLAVVFQDYSRSLMPWMSVEHNVLLPLRSQPISKQQRVKRARAALAAVGLSGAVDQYPWQLSGGMQQRVAIMIDAVPKVAPSA